MQKQVLESMVSLNVGVGAVGAVNAGTNTGTAQGKAEGKKWYKANWLKLAVRAVVVGAAVALAVTGRFYCGYSRCYRN